MTFNGMLHDCKTVVHRRQDIRTDYGKMPDSVDNCKNGAACTDKRLIPLELLIKEQFQDVNRILKSKMCY
jgi:hypothetical protein